MQKGFKGLLRGGMPQVSPSAAVHEQKYRFFFFIIFFFSGTASLVLVDLMVE